MDLDTPNEHQSAAAAISAAATPEALFSILEIEYDKTNTVETQARDLLKRIPFNMIDWQHKGEPRTLLNKGNTLLHKACKAGHVEVVKMLLAHPAIDVNLQNDKGATALHACCGRPECLQLLVKGFQGEG